MRNLHNGPTRYIMKLASSVKTTLDSFVEGTALTPMEARALLFVATSSEALCQKDLEQEYGLSRATVSELMQGMERKGLICRRKDPVDRRRNRIVVCEEARPLAESMIERMSAVEAQLSEGIPAADVERFLEIIERMSGNLPPTGKNV